MKRRRGKRFFDSAEEFIERIASKSSWRNTREFASAGVILAVGTFQVVVPSESMRIVGMVERVLLSVNHSNFPATNSFSSLCSTEKIRDVIVAPSGIDGFEK